MIITSACQKVLSNWLKHNLLFILLNVVIPNTAVPDAKIPMKVIV
jgi:hypothetical protein